MLRHIKPMHPGTAIQNILAGMEYAPQISKNGEKYLQGKWGKTSQEAFDEICKSLGGVSVEVHYAHFAYQKYRKLMNKMMCVAMFAVLVASLLLL